MIRWEKTISSSFSSRKRREEARRQLIKWSPALNKLIRQSLDENVAVGYRQRPSKVLLAYDKGSFPASLRRIKSYRENVYREKKKK